MYTSVTEARLKAGLGYLAGAIITAAAGWAYELFSHGIYSNYMIYAFMIPLICGALPNLMTAFRAVKKRTAERGRGSAASVLQLAGIATLTAGSLIKGALEIYGTTNRLTVIYPVLGLALLAAALISYAAQNRRGRRSEFGTEAL